MAAGLSQGQVETIFREVVPVAAVTLDAAVCDAGIARDRIERNSRHRLAVAGNDLRGTLDSILVAAEST